MIYCVPFALLINFHAPAQSNDDGTIAPLYIGIEKRRIPYTYLDDQHLADGLLVNMASKMCEAIDAQCRFIAGTFDNLLQDLQTSKLDGLLIIDDVILPDIDGIKLTSPLCDLQPVFIQQKVDVARKRRRDFAKTTIGVLEASLFHLYLLDEYSSFARIKSYPLLEGAVFDLKAGRIDAIFTDLAFFNERILNNPLGRGNQASTMITLSVETPGFPDTGMTLAINEQQLELFSVVEKELQNQGSVTVCSDPSESSSVELIPSGSVQ